MKIFRSQPYYQERGAMSKYEDFEDHEGKVAFLRTENIWYVDRIRANLFYTQAKLRSTLRGLDEDSTNYLKIKNSLIELDESLNSLNEMDDILHRRGYMPWDE